MNESEYRTRYNELVGRLVHVETIKYSVSYEYYGPRTTTYRLCMVNGVRYVVASNISYMLTERRNINVTKGYLKEGDMPCFYGHNGTRNQPTIFVNVEALARQESNLRDILSDEYGHQLNIAKAIIASVMKEQVENVVISSDEYERGQQAYSEICQLRRERRKENKRNEEEAAQEYERQLEEIRIKEAKWEEDTLRDLVERIEALGWNVSLSLKK